MSGTNGGVSRPNIVCRLNHEVGRDTEVDVVVSHLEFHVVDLDEARELSGHLES